MVVAGAIKRSTGENIKPQGGIAFLLDAPDVHFNVRLSRVEAACSPYCEEPRKPGFGFGSTIFPFSGSPVTI